MRTGRSRSTRYLLRAVFVATALLTARSAWAGPPRESGELNATRTHLRAFLAERAPARLGEIARHPGVDLLVRYHQARLLDGHRSALGIFGEHSDLEVNEGGYLWRHGKGQGSDRHNTMAEVTAAVDARIVQLAKVKGKAQGQATVRRARKVLEEQIRDMHELEELRRGEIEYPDLSLLVHAHLALGWSSFEDSIPLVETPQLTIFASAAAPTPLVITPRGRAAELSELRAAGIHSMAELRALVEEKLTEIAPEDLPDPPTRRAKARRR